MTAKGLIKELQKILKERKGRDYPIWVWTGLGKDETHVIEFVQLLESESEGEPETDHIALYTPGACEDMGHYNAGLELKGKPELN